MEFITFITLSATKGINCHPALPPAKYSTSGPVLGVRRWITTRVVIGSHPAYVCHHSSLMLA